MNKLSIGNYVLNARIKHGLTQSQLAKIIGVSDKTISKWETGKGIPEVQSLLPLCEALNITVDDLLRAGLREIENNQKENS